MKWPARSALETALAEVDAVLAARGDDAEGFFLRGCILRDLGRDDDAIAAYRQAIELEPERLEARRNLAVALHRAGRRIEARTVLERTAALHPLDPSTHVLLGNLLAADLPDQARSEFEAALAIDPDQVQAHQGLCSLYAVAGDAERAAHHRTRGFEGRATALLPYRGEAWPIPALLLVSTDGGNLYAEHLLDDRVFQTTRLYVEAFESGELPAHRIVVNGIADADLAGAALDRAASLVARSTAPIVNEPRNVARTTREQNAWRLRSIDGVRTARTERFNPCAPPEFPFLLRARGHHMGRFFGLVEDAAQLEPLLNEFPSELLAIEYVDTRSDDGMYRKYRVMIAGGELHPIHLAIAPLWKVHYFSSAMAEREDFRKEEARFLADMRSVLGARTVRALQAIAAALELDYAGIDFGLDRAGKLVVYEANAAMTVTIPGAEPAWEYRRASAGRVIDAVRTKILSRLTI
jgi:tetratricopeptide (TPR) repeat protein